MKTTFVKSDDAETLSAALGEMIDFARFLADEYGFQDAVDHIDTILNKYGIDTETIDD